MKNTNKKVGKKNKSKLLNKLVIEPFLPRKAEDIHKEIKRLIKDDSNFVRDNYGSEAADNGEFEIYFSEHATEATLKRFAKWLLGDKDNILKLTDEYSL